MRLWGGGYIGLEVAEALHHQGVKTRVVTSGPAVLERTLDPDMGTLTAGYWPEAQLMCLKVLAERGSGRLLGAQSVGGRGSGKRIDVLATALWSAMRLDELMQLDVAYAPPFAPVWDPVLIAARKAWETSREGR